MTRRAGLAPPGDEGDGVPEGWARTRVGDVVVNVPNSRPDAEPDREFGYVDISSVCNETNRIVATKRYSGRDAPSRARRPIQPGDVLFSNVRTYLRNIAMVSEGLDADICSTGFTVLRSSGAVDPTFLLGQVLTDAFINEVTPQQTGSQYPATTDRVVLSASFFVPPLAEQHRIVAKVEDLLARVNAAGERLAKVPALLKRFRQAVLAAACSGRLTEEWRNAKPRREDETAAGQPLTTDDASISEAAHLPEIPDEWRWENLGQLLACGPQNGLYRPRSDYGRGVPIVRINDYQNFVTPRKAALLLVDVDRDEAAKYGLRAGDVLINRVNSPSHIGKCMVVPNSLSSVVFESNMMRLTPGAELQANWLAVYLASGAGKAALTEGAKWAVNQVSINQGDVEQTPVPLPPLSEQHEIVRRVQALFTLADAIEKRVARATARVEKTTQAILAKAFRGELVPTEAELARQEGRDYEPASTLLERIRAERAAASSERSGRAKRPRSAAAPKAVAPSLPSLTTAAEREGAEPRNIPEAILAHLQPGRACSRAEVCEALGLTSAEWAWAIRELKESGRVQQSGERRGARYSLTPNGSRPGKEAQ